MPSPDPLASYNRRRFLRTSSASALLPLVTYASDRPNITVRFSHVVAEATPKGMAARRFKELVEQRSGKRIAVLIFPDSQLYGDHDEMQALQLGAVDMIAPSLSKFGSIGLPEFELFDLPFLFEDVANVRRITHGSLGQRLLERLENQGLVGLGFFDNGFKQMSANRPLLEAADFKGLRMRIQSSQVIAAQMRALGARPVTLDFSETRLALATGVVDGTENPISNFWTQAMHQVQSDLSLTNHGYLGYAVVANQHFWQYLPKPDRELINAAMQEALTYANQIADMQNDLALAALSKTGSTRIHTLTESQRSRLQQAVQPVLQALERRIGAVWVHELQKALNTPAS